MQILFVCHRFPYPPNRGGKIRPFHIIRHLHEQGHDVIVCSLVRSDAEADQSAGIAPYCTAYHAVRVHEPIQFVRMVACLPLTTPSSMGHFHSPALARRIRQLMTTRHFELIMVHCSSVAPYVEDVESIPKILDFGDMDSQKWFEYARYKPFPLSCGYRLEANKLMAAEQRLAQRFEVCTTTTRAECDTLEAYGTGAATDWFPIGVDTAFFAPTGASYDPHTISFIGHMDYYPNQECMRRFCDTVWPLLKAKDPAMKLLIVGADPPRAIRALAQRPGVTVTGTVDDVRPYVRNSAAMVAPLAIARGTQNKLLEAMAMAVPTITSSAALGGVDAEPEQHFLVADGAQEIADAVWRVTAHPAERARLAAAGRARMLSHHSWEGAMRRLDRIIERAVATAPRGARRKGAHS